MDMKWLISGLIMVFLSGCGSVTLDTGAPQDTSNRFDEYYDSWMLGFAGEGLTDVHNACTQDKIARIRNYFSVEDILLTALTVGIYSPRTTTITCAMETAHASPAD